MSTSETPSQTVSFTQADIDAYYTPLKNEGLMFTEIPSPVDFAIAARDVQQTARDLALLQDEKDIGLTYEVATKAGVTMTFNDKETSSGENADAPVFSYQYQKPESSESLVQFSIGLKRDPKGGANYCYQFAEGTTLADAIKIVSGVAPNVTEMRSKLHEFVEGEEDILADQFARHLPQIRQISPKYNDETALILASRNAEALSFRQLFERLSPQENPRTVNDSMVAKANAAVRGLKRKQQEEQK